MPKILLFILFSWEEIIPTQVVGGDTTMVLKNVDGKDCLD